MLIVDHRGRELGRVAGQRDGEFFGFEIAGTPVSPRHRMFVEARGSGFARRIYLVSR